MFILLILSVIINPWADSSPEIEYGDGAGYGQAYYPDNILGPPDPDATPSSPSFGENNLLTLGKDGWVVLEFTDNSIINEEGPDFTVFENVMETSQGYFQECAFVEVSQDGEYWLMFPWDAATLEGLAGVYPTTGQDPTNPAISGGDQFDLEILDLDWVRFVRLTDCGDSVDDGGLFDLDAIASINWSTGIIESNSVFTQPFSINSPFNYSFTIDTKCAGALNCYTIDGRLVSEWAIQEGQTSLNAEYLPSGVLFFVMDNTSVSAVKLLN